MTTTTTNNKDAVTIEFLSVASRDAAMTDLFRKGERVTYTGPKTLSVTPAQEKYLVGRRHNFTYPGQEPERNLAG